MTMGLKTVYLPGNVPVRFVTIPGCARIRIDIEGSIQLGYDHDDQRLFVFGDLDRKPVKPPLPEDQARALMQELVRYDAERRGICTSDSGQSQDNVQPQSGPGHQTTGPVATELQPDDDQRTSRAKQPMDSGERLRQLIGEVMNEEIDLDYRPKTYFRPRGLEHYLLSNVKSAVLRRNLQALFDAGKHDEVMSLLGTKGISVAEQKALERFHLLFMGGKYLPGMAEGEVTVACIDINSTFLDATWVNAWPVAGGIRYRVIDGYGGETLEGETEAWTEKPMTLGEFTDFFLQAWHLINLLPPNDLERSLDFFFGRSEFYPDFDRLCRRRVIEHFLKLERDKKETN